MKNENIEVIKENEIFGVTEDEEMESTEIIEEKKDGEENVSSENK